MFSSNTFSYISKKIRSLIIINKVYHFTPSSFGYTDLVEHDPSGTCPDTFVKLCPNA